MRQIKILAFGAFIFAAFTSVAVGQQVTTSPNHTIGDKAIKIRRVVTGHSTDGKSVFASDLQVKPIEIEGAPGLQFYRLWGSDSTAHFPDDGAPPMMQKYFPPVGGYRVVIFTVPPQSPAPANVDPKAVNAEIERKLPGLLEYMEPDAPGMHTTNTVDFEYVISGHVILELDDGATRELGPGDTIVQNGTRHAWRNPYSEPCKMVVFMVGAVRAGGG